MKSILLGHEKDAKREVRIPKNAFSTHFHLIGGTGKGKTTAIHTLLRPLLRDPSDRSCAIIIDRLGNLSDELLLWMASEEFCTDDVRERLVYIQPSREDMVLPMNPLMYETPAHGYYKVERATEIVLRAWESVNIEAMPRLARWTFNAFWAAAQLDLTIADCSHLLMPGSNYHKELLDVLPPALQAEWREISNPRSSQEATRILDSSRNRLKPYFESDILRRMFGTTQHRFNAEQFMREGKIVIVDLSPRNRLASQLGNTIGALILNEVIATARNLPRGTRYPTYVLLDEFQNFVGPDIESALPEVRQLGLKLLLSHQSFSQLKRGDYDLTSMIFQAQSRMAFGIQGEDADFLANEFASIMYDSRRIKEEIYTRRQLNAGHRIVELTSWSDAESEARNWNETYGKNWSRNTSTIQPPRSVLPTESTGGGTGTNESEGRGRSAGRTLTRGSHQTLVPEHEEFLELASRTYESFDEQKSEWAKKIRNLATGECILRLVDEPSLKHVKVRRSAPGYLKYDMTQIHRHFPEVIDNMNRLIEDNFASDLFVPASVIDRESEQRLQNALRPKITVQPNTSSVDGPKDPFV
ncbi:MAG: type IV secretion system DNA-binding domain-containing protein [Planctomycetaceae bacterium]|nr:type IV secretion system DNA-binding domain-containing protein [Planctomycetales bacterium]MCB9924521.1 type IV secretion system DNA-binding domain-containing protein [Planctomycetaceae bacterium]